MFFFLPLPSPPLSSFRKKQEERCWQPLSLLQHLMPPLTYLEGGLLDAAASNMGKKVWGQDCFLLSHISALKINMWEVLTENKHIWTKKKLSNSRTLKKRSDGQSLSSFHGPLFPVCGQFISHSISDTKKKVTIRGFFFGGGGGGKRVAKRGEGGSFWSFLAYCPKNEPLLKKLTQFFPQGKKKRDGNGT